jgi:NTE family protein
MSQDTGTEKKIRVALSGSGFLAPAHAGALCAFMDYGCTIVELAGTSGGSIVAAVAAIGGTQADLRQIALEASFQNLLEASPLGFLETMSYCDGTALLHWLERHTSNKLMKDVKIPMSAVSTDVTTGKRVIFSDKLTPDLPIAFACRASASVPFVYQPVNYKNTVLVDGGVMDNMPADILVRDSLPRFGIRVRSPYKGSTDGPLSMALSLVNLLLTVGERDKIAVAELSGARIIEVQSDNLGFLNTNLTPEQRMTLFQLGYTQVERCLTTT